MRVCVWSQSAFFLHKQAGHLLETFKVKGRHCQINSMVSLPNLLLVAVKDALHLLMAESLEVVWSAPCYIGLLRCVRERERERGNIWDWS